MASKHRRPPHHGGTIPSPRPAAPPVPSTEEQAPAAQPAARPVFHEKDRIGDILRRVREHRGEDLDLIADYLRIRPSFLVALEESRYEDLPADAYVIGFLRTYANFLGLDGRGAIDQYRREMAGRRRKPQLSMPQPMPESRAPTITILVAAAVACLLLYSLWYGLSTPDRDVIAKPVPLPTDTVETPPAATTTPKDPASEALAATPAGDLLLQTTTGASAAVSNLAAAKDQAAPEQKTDSKEAEKIQPPEQKPAAPLPETPPQGQVFGETGKTRLSLRADKESWILITDSKGITVFDRTLKTGESYNVPADKGYKLTTGNVAGVVFVLDGKDLPKLQTDGRVARAVPLDPDKLPSYLSGKKSGKAEKPAEAAPSEEKTEKPSDL